MRLHTEWHRILDAAVAIPLVHQLEHFKLGKPENTLCGVRVWVISDYDAGAVTCLWCIANKWRGGW